MLGKDRRKSPLVSVQASVRRAPYMTLSVSSGLAASLSQRGEAGRGLWKTYGRSSGQCSSRVVDEMVSAEDNDLDSTVVHTPPP